VDGGRVSEVQGGVGVDGEENPSAARVHDAGDDCDYWSREVGAEASRPREGRRGVHDLGPMECARAQTTDPSCKEADKDRLAEDRRLGRESEADSDKPRSGLIPARASIPQYETRAHPLPTRVLPIHTSLSSPSRSIFSPHRPPLTPPTHTHRCRSSHTSRRSGVDARDAPLESAEHLEGSVDIAYCRRSLARRTMRVRMGMEGRER
jgi:hypothetical protein